MFLRSARGDTVGVGVAGGDYFVGETKLSARKPGPL